MKYNRTELLELMRQKKYPEEFVGRHPYDHRETKYVFVGKTEPYKDIEEHALYNCDTGHTLALETIIKHQVE